jgi:chromosome segregation ATPase
VDENDPEERQRVVKHVQDNLNAIFSEFDVISEKLDILGDPSLQAEEREELTSDIEKRREAIFQSLLHIDLNFSIIEQIAANIRSIFERIDLAQRQIQKTLLDLLISQDDLRRIVRKTKRNSPEARSLQRKYGRTLDDFIRMDKDVRMAEKTIKRLEKEAGNTYEELKIVVDRINKGEKEAHQPR